MELRHEFTVPATIEETWTPSTTSSRWPRASPEPPSSSVEGDTFTGSCKVKLGPIALVYNGTGTFVEKDESARRMVIDAKGKDKRGNGTAGAHVTATMTEEGTSTRVEVLTDLNITGKPAQFGRGVMQDVSDKLLGQFTQCLEQKVGDSSAAARAADLAGGDTSSSPDTGSETATGSGTATGSETAAGTGNGTDRTIPQPDPSNPEERMHNMRDPGNGDRAARAGRRGCTTSAPRSVRTRTLRAMPARSTSARRCCRCSPRPTGSRHSASCWSCSCFVGSCAAAD